MQAKILAFFLAFAGAVGKKMLVEASPVLVGMSRQLGETIFDVSYDELDPNLTTADKDEIHTLALEEGNTLWLVAKKEGVLLADDLAGLALQAAASDIASEIGI